MTLPRRLEPEWLDELASDDPRAVRSRRDLKRVNMIMMNARHLAGELRRHAARRPVRAMTDLGCGDGALTLQVARRLAPHWTGVRLTLVDQQDIVSATTRQRFAALGWQVQTVKADIFAFLDQAAGQPGDVMTANLFLHHFSADRLSRLLASAAKAAWLFGASEPRRAKFAVRASRLLWVIGCNDVTVHDAVLSARAGFIADELSALWPRDPGWDLHEHPAGMFSHCFIARRDGAASPAR